MEVKPLISINYELLFQLINTLLVYLLLKKLLFKPVTEFMSKRAAEVENNLSMGEKAKIEGEEYKKQYESKIELAKQESQEIIKQATTRAEQKSEEIVSDAKSEASRLIERAQGEIVRERQKVMHELKNDISSIALLAASKVIEQDLDEAKHEKLINDFIKEVGEAK
jgi:F-type H+-transporting ATPase subunit b